MLNIYTKNSIPNSYKLITNVEYRYRSIISNNPDRLMNDIFIQKAFRIIDKAVQQGDRLTTPFGNCYFSECSTGTKAVILAYLYGDTNKLVNISECGENAIALLATEPYNFNTYLSTEIRLGKSERLVGFNGTRMTLSQANKEVLYERIKNNP